MLMRSGASHVGGVGNGWEWPHWGWWDAFTEWDAFINGVKSCVQCRIKDKKALQLAGKTLLKHSEFESAKEVLLKLEDWQSLIKLHVQAEAWSHAFMTAKRCPSEEPALHETYAEWLVDHDRCVTPFALHQHDHKLAMARLQKPSFE
jgi:hypothetical protein